MSPLRAPVVRRRGRLVDAGTVVASYCYDMADRQIAASGIAYDGHQNQVLHDGDTYRYDQADRHLSTVVAGVRQVTLARDALDRIVARTDTDLATNTTSTVRYGFAGAGDLVSSVWDTANNLVETTISLPGGVIYTKRTGTGTDVWSYPNLHGDVAATRVNGTVTTFNWDPYGNPINNLPDNSAGTVDWGWLGQHQRTLDHPSGLNPVIEMGARVYQPDTGRFQQTDPIEDGTTNPYSYVPDPINQYDLDGQCGRWGNPWKKCGKGHRGEKGFLGGTFSKSWRGVKCVGGQLADWDSGKGSLFEYGATIAVSGTGALLYTGGGAFAAGGGAAMAAAAGPIVVGVFVASLGALAIYRACR